jgi:hypothetical protein
MQEAIDTQKSLTVSLIIGLLIAAVSIVVTDVNDSIYIFHLSNSHTVTAIMTFFLSSALCFLVSDTGKYRFKLLSICILYGCILSVISIYLPTVATPSSVTLLCFGTYAGLCMIQSYHQADYTHPDYTLFFASVWNIFCMCFLSSVFLGFVYILVGICAAIFSIFNLSILSSIIKDPFFHLTLVPVALSMGYYVTSKWTKLVFSTRMILLEFIRILLPIFSVITWFLVVLLIIHILFNTQIDLSQESLSNFSLCLSLYSLFSINAVYMDGNSLDRLSHRYQKCLIALCLAIPFLLISCLFTTLTSTPSPFFNQQNIALFALILLSMLYAISYIYAALKKSSPWMSSLKTANIKLAWLLMALAIVFNLPTIQWLPKPHSASDSSAQTHKKNQAKTIQEGSKQTKKEMKKIGLSFKDKANATPTVLGYRHNQALYACQPKKGNIPIGIVINGTCQAINKHNRIISYDQFRLLSGNSKNTQWSLYLSSALYFYHTSSTQRYNLCRRIINNRVYVGVMQMSVGDRYRNSPTCQFIIDHQIINNINFDSFGLKY